jgi:hypothetical protein
MTQDYKLYQAPVANTITFHSMNAGWLMRITADRRIEVADGVDVTEAAQKVLDAMQSMLDVGLEKAVLAEREACAKVCDDKHDTWRWDDEADSASGPRDCAAAIRARGQA